VTINKAQGMSAGGTNDTQCQSHQPSLRVMHSY